MKSLKIGNIRLKNRLFLAPMVDVSDLPYRLLCREAGAGMAYTEMLHIGSILYANNKKTKNILKTCRADSPVGLQITGRNVKEFEQVSKRKELQKFDVIDINCGCPSIRITRGDSGSYLLRNPDKIGDMVRVLKDKGFTTTVKIRIGFRKNNVMKVSRAVEKAGADLLTIHARLASQGRSIPADWKWIAKVKKKIGISVIGNGDVFSGKDAAKMLDICDGAMIARGAIGNPLIFSEILYYLRTGKERLASPEKKIAEFRNYLGLAKKYDVLEMPRVKYLGAHFLKGFEGAGKMRDKFMKLRSFSEVESFVKSL